jgi:hypothetical protein
MLLKEYAIMDLKKRGARRVTGDSGLRPGRARRPREGIDLILRSAGQLVNEQRGTVAPAAPVKRSKLLRK